MKHCIFCTYVILIAFSFICISCSGLEGKDALGRTRSQTVSGRPHGNGHSFGSDTSVYITALEFPRGYNWKKDTLYGNVDCKLVLFKNGARTLELPAKFDNQISPDPDTHRVIDGHLYTDYCTDGETIISRDGQSLFHYQGEELMSGFLVKDEDVYTLGQDRSGRGFSFRKNGEFIFKKDNGEIMGSMYDSAYEKGALYESGGHLYFSYYTTSISGKTLEKKYFLVDDGVEVRIDSEKVYDEIYDLRMFDGVLYKTVKVKGSHYPLSLFSGDSRSDLGKNNNIKVISAFILPYANDVLVQEIFVNTKSDNGFMSIWKSSGFVGSYNTDTDLYAEEDKLYAVEMNTSGYVYQFRFGAKSMKLSNKYYFISNHCATVENGHFYLALTSAGINMKPVFWKDADSSTVNIENGYVTSVSVCP
jgi:hypothetical protein